MSGGMTLHDNGNYCGGVSKEDVVLITSLIVTFWSLFSDIQEHVAKYEKFR